MPAPKIHCRSINVRFGIVLVEKCRLICGAGWYRRPEVGEGQICLVLKGAVGKMHVPIGIEKTEKPKKQL